MKRWGIMIIFVSALAGSSFAASIPAGIHKKANRILEETGTTGGLVVHLGNGDGKLTAALGMSERCVVQEKKLGCPRVSLESLSEAASVFDAGMQKRGQAQ